MPCLLLVGSVVATSQLQQTNHLKQGLSVSLSRTEHLDWATHSLQLVGYK
jgi:hypothetical protein